MPEVGSSELRVRGILQVHYVGIFELKWGLLDRQNPAYWTPIMNILRLALLFTFFWIGSQLTFAEQPNFLVILADDLGFSDLGCYGGEIETPHLDRLAANGLRFTQFYNTARCWPTRGALLTGYYAQQIGRDALPKVAGGGQGQRPKWAQLLPNMLKAQGYRSYISGKWHVDGKPTQNGFDHSYIVENHNNFFYAKQHFLDDKKLAEIPKESGHYVTTAIADHAIQFLKEHHSQHAGKPFFQYLAFTSPHFPIQAPTDAIAKYSGKYNSGWNLTRGKRWQRIESLGLVRGKLSDVEPEVGPPYDFPDAFVKLGAGETNRPIAWDNLNEIQKAFQAAKMEIHAAMVDRMDAEIGRIIEVLRSNKQLDNTLVLFLSDNGASAEIMVRGDGHNAAAPLGSAETYLCLGPGWSNTANTPFRRHKTWVHEGGISTPLIAHWPKAIHDAGKIRHGLGHVIDIAPTLVKLAGGTWPTEVDGEKVPETPGRDFSSAFGSDDILKPRQALWWLHEGNRALRDSDWKIVATKDQPWELYNMSNDRTETQNLATQMPEKVTELQAIWDRYTEEFTQLRGR
jgi:arylsulfatase A-like enzyme